jgi:Ca2+-binding RTX toxin-like protein
VDTTLVQIADTGARLHAGLHCVETDTSHAVCDIGTAFLEIAEVHLGDGDDRAVSAGPPLRAFGGPGRDRLQGADDHVDLDGGEAADTLIAGGAGGRLVGGPGSDHVTGAPSRDAIVDGDGRRTARDFYDGRGGGDSLSYAGRRRPLTVDLPAHRAGARGERDRVTGIADVTGGSGADVFIGNRFDNTFEGLAGNDRLSGGGGDDTLHGGTGRDVMSGGPGDDEVGGADVPGRPVADTMACGAGHDDVRPLGFDVLSRCETASVTTSDSESTFSARPVAATPGGMTFRVLCLSASTTTARCAGRLRLAGGRPRRSYGSVGYDVPVGTDGLDTTETHAIRVRLTPAGRRALAVRRLVPVRVGVRGASWVARM